MASTEARLQLARQYAQAGQPQAAIPVLVEYLKGNPTSEQGWLLLSQCLTNPKQKRDCLERVLRLNPLNAEARAQLAALTAAPAKATTAPASAAPEVEPAKPAAVPAPATPAGEMPGVETQKPAALDRLNALLGSNRMWLGGVVVLVVFLVGLIGAMAVVVANKVRPTQTAVVVPTTLAPTLTRTLTPTMTPTPKPSITPTIRPLDPTVVGEMDLIQAQVYALRGLTVEQTLAASYFIPTSQLEGAAAGLLLDDNVRAALPDLARVYYAFGLLARPDYDLKLFVLNSRVHSRGFYAPGAAQVFVAGNEFGGLERLVYAREYGRFLADTYYQVQVMGIYPQCLGETQRCEAVRALVEGEATLLSGLWLEQYANPDDYEALWDYEPPKQVLPDRTQNVPPFMSRQANWLHEKGVDFVRVLYRRGNWAEVNRAYVNLPQSTEQILHPVKYTDGEAPVSVNAPPLTDTLGAGWRLVDNNVLGEWMTYLMLGYSADVSAQQPDADAALAAAGWGGDRYQIYYHDVRQQTVLAAQWVWDTPVEANEFKQLMLKYLEALYRGGKLADRPAGNCWEANKQTTCLFAKERGQLWIVAPDQATLDAVLAQCPDFP